MNNHKKNSLREHSLRAGLCLFMLSGACAVSAQTDIPAPPTAPADNSAAAVPAKPASTVALREVSGTIYDGSTKQPLGGVRVQALNNRFYMAMTNENGQYTIRVPEYVTALYVSTPDFNGIQIPIKGDSGQDAIVYSDAFEGFYENGTELLHKSKMTVDNTSALTVENDIENKLNASVRTVNRGGLPAQGAALFIHGLHSLNSTSQPLVIVDGVMWDMQYDRTTLHDGFYTDVFNVIDTEDIESVEVIKNGTALYGAKGGNGVINIKTKRGSSMATRINIRIYGGFEQVPSTLDVMNAEQYRNYVTEFLGTTSSAKTLASSTTIPFMIEDKNYLLYNLYHNDTDWQKDLYQTSFMQNYKVSVEGGDDVAMYNLSLGYSQTDATAKQNDFQRLNIRFNTDIQVFKNFSTELDIAYSRVVFSPLDNGWAEDYSSSNISSPNVLGLVQSPFVSQYAYFVRYEDDALNLVHSDHVYSGQNYTDSNNPFTFASDFGFEGLANPYWILENGEGTNKNDHEQTQFSVNVAPKWTPNQYITVSDRFSYILNRVSEKYYMPYSGTPQKEVEGLGTVTSEVSTQFSKETTLYNEFRVDWNRQYGAHTVGVFGGMRLSSYSYSNSYVTGYNNDNDKMPNLSYSLQYKSYGGTNDSWINLAYFVNADYNYKNRYFVQGTLTAESSSRFGDEAEEGVKLFGVCWGIFPSIQGGWVISNEEWFKGGNAVNYVKLTAGYDESGNDNISDYYAARTYFENIKFLDKATALVLSNIENTTIQWETTRTASIGLQAGFLKNRLFLGFEFYNSNTSNLLTKKTISDITGLDYVWTNDGKLRNRGVEGSLHGIILSTKNWKWEAGLSIGHYKNEIIDLPVSSTITTYALDESGNEIAETANTIHGYTSSIYGDNNVLTAVGHSAGVFYGYQTAGVFSTDDDASEAGKYGYLRYPTGLADNSYRNFRAGDVHFVDQNDDGWISEADMVVIGDPNPDVYGNFYTSLTWKNLRLDVNFKYSLGNDIYNYQRAQLESMNNIWNQTTAVANRWRYEGQVTDIPRTMSTESDEWVNNERFSDRWIEDGSYLKLKKVRLTYKIPVNWNWLQGLSVWGEANNVFTVSEYLGTDPEVSAGNSTLYQGIDAGYLASSRSFVFGVNINL